MHSLVPRDVRRRRGRSAGRDPPNPTSVNFVQLPVRLAPVEPVQRARCCSRRWNRCSNGSAASRETRTRGSCSSVTRWVGSSRATTSTSLGGHEVTAKVITLGTPYRGALDALDLARQRGAQGDRPDRLRPHANSPAACPRCSSSCPSTRASSRATACAKTTETVVPEVDAAMVADAMRFHDELRDGRRPRTPVRTRRHPILARTQPTDTTARHRGRLGRGDAHDPYRPRRRRRPEGRRHGAAPVGRAVRRRRPNSPVIALRDGQARRAAEERSRARRARWRAHGDVDGARGDVPVPIGVVADDVLVAGEALAATFEAGDVAILEASIVGVTDAGRVANDGSGHPGERSRPHSRRRSRARLLRAARPFDASRARHRRDPLRRPRPARMTGFCVMRRPIAP